jgi:hypothetical protein
VAEPHDELKLLPSDLGDAVASRTTQPAIPDTPLPAKDI